MAIIGGYVIDDLTGARTPLHATLGRASAYGAPTTRLTAHRNPAIQLEIEKQREAERAAREAERLAREEMAERKRTARAARADAARAAGPYRDEKGAAAIAQVLANRAAEGPTVHVGGG